LITLTRVTPQNAMVFKAVRLRALQDTPSAFGSTYGRESQLADAEWIDRATKWNGDHSILFLALDGEIGCGIAGSHLDPDDSARAHLISMWTAPTHRRHGVGCQLVNEVVAWARARGSRTLLLMVTSSNEGAMRFYEQLGFSRTGVTAPYPNDPALIEYQMSRPIIASLFSKK
jgi:ribosomal protein S18 acetylase RimI-like enzyme